MREAWKGPRHLLAVASFCLLLGGCEDSSDGKIKIDREHRAVRAQDWFSETGPEWKEVGGGLYEAVFVVPPSFLVVYMGDGSGPVDPFADPSPSERVEMTAQESLEYAGITFGEGASAKYYPKSGLLVVVQTKDQMELVETYTCSWGYDPEKQIAIRMELYELGAVDGLKLLESAQGEGEHSPERQAIQNILGKRGTKLVAAPSVIARSGQRALIGSGPSSSASKEEKDTDVLSKRTTQEFTLEVDPVLGADEYTIDLNFAFIQHEPTTPPITDKEEHFQEEDHRVISQVTMKDNNYVLVGGWTIPSSADSGEGRMRLLFLTASIQRVGGWGAQLPAENARDEP